MLNRLALIAFSCLLFITAPAGAADTASAMAFVQSLGDTALSSLTDKSLPPKAREDRTRNLLRKYFDIKTIGRFALGTHWKTATSAEQSEYMGLFEDMIVSTYASRFGEYSGQSLEVGKSRPIGKRDFIVNSKILQTDGPPVNVDWQVRHKNGKLKVIDVQVENVSMLITQRNEFAAVIQRNGGEVSSLLETLRKRKGG
ncbi:MAG: ABC transporter substrate-binding protein [Alphaproteobacteria bacterium]|nr:ABC transporter substrate-binding protein [Alphaproteobacteria bacterium]